MNDPHLDCPPGGVDDMDPVDLVDDWDPAADRCRGQQAEPHEVWLAVIWAVCGFFAGVAVTAFLL